MMESFGLGVWQEFGFILSCTEKRWSAAGVAHNVVMGSENSESIFDMYFIIDTCTIPFLV